MKFRKYGRNILFINAWNVEGAISEVKGHDQKLVVAIMCAEIHFRDIILMNPNLVIPKTKIQLGEKMSTMKLINNRNCKLIHYCDVIKCLKVNVDVS